MGQSYLLGCPEGGESRLRDAVKHVDDAMCKIRDAGKVKTRDRIAVLAALNLAFDLSDRDTPQARTATPSADGGESDPQLASLLERLDAVLSDDGQLI